MYYFNDLSFYIMSTRVIWCKYNSNLLYKYICCCRCIICYTRRHINHLPALINIESELQALVSEKAILEHICIYSSTCKSLQKSNTFDIIIIFIDFLI